MYSETFMKIFIIQTTLVMLAVAVAGIFSPSLREFQATGSVIAIRNVTVIPGNGAAPINDATVVVRGEYIAAIGPSAEMVIPTGRTCDRRTR